MRFVVSLSATIVTALLTADHEAHANESRAPRFGEPGETVVTASSSIGISSEEFDRSDAKYFSAGFSPGADYFITRGVSIGLDVSLWYSYSRGYGADGSLVATKTTTFLGGPRLGVNLPLGESVSFYPRLTGYVEWRQSNTGIVSGPSLSVPSSPFGATTTTYAGPGVTLFAPFLIHLAPHFFIGAGPGVSHSFARAQAVEVDGGERTGVFGRVLVGGFWGGSAPVDIGIENDDDTSARPDGEIASGDPPPPPPGRFGQAGQWVLDGELAASGGWTTYAGADASSGGVYVAPGCDYFVLPHVSLGGGVYVSYSYASGLQPTGPRVVGQRNDVGILGRVGAELPLGRTFSLYPRLTLGFGSESFSQQSGTITRETAYSSVSMSAYVPLLVHVATHFFIGFGPFFGQDISQKADEGSSFDNLGTRVGAGLIVGGWL